MDKSVGERLRRMRGSRSISEVAAACGITPSAISNYESNIRVPRDAIKMKIAAYYKKSVAYLFYADFNQET